ncbi:MAG TPA: CinA family nicotinamide mononucleotide deamidase-related protein, partial [Myxococcaceae bacterium]|nr:CinA family nicotinamide mononucleotide deamidase-related protein [Myxococcaceae bacterium]
LTTDTNSPYFMAKLFELGEMVSRSQTVGDVRQDIIEALKAASGRADAVLVSGGLGPTMDDLTAESAAAAAGVTLVEDRAVLESLRTRFAKRQLPLTPNNARQALVPEGAEVVHNRFGTAPMFIQRVGGCTLFFVPGVPREYKALVDSEVLPRLAEMIERQPGRIFRAARLLKTVGIFESHLDALIKPLAKAHSKVKFGFRTHAPENHLKLLAEAGSQGEADDALGKAERACREVLGPFLFGADQDSFPAVVGALLRDRKETVALAESCTGGLASQLLTSPPGASAYAIGAVVAYSNEMKTRWLGVSEQMLAPHGAVSEEVSRAMAEGVRRRCESTYGISITGIAGPSGGTEQKPVGTVFLALSSADQTESQRQQLLGDRERIRQFAAYHALDMLRHRLIRLGKNR